MFVFKLCKRKKLVFCCFCFLDNDTSQKPAGDDKYFSMGENK